MYEGEARSSSRISFAISQSLNREVRYVGESIRHEKEIWPVARRGYLNARDLFTRPRAYLSPLIYTATPARAQTLVHLQRTPSPSTPDKNPHGLESQIIQCKLCISIHSVEAISMLIDSYSYDKIKYYYVNCHKKTLTYAIDIA